MSLARSTELVVDASAFVEYLIGSDLAAPIGSVVESPDSRLNAPALCDVEVCSALRGMVRRGALDVERAWDVISDYRELPLVKHGHAGLVGRIFELRDNFTASDATYIALCEVIGATLVTSDARLTRAVQNLLPLNVIGVAP